MMFSFCSSTIPQIDFNFSFSAIFNFCLCNYYVSVQTPFPSLLLFPNSISASPKFIFPPSNAEVNFAQYLFASRKCVLILFVLLRCSFHEHDLFLFFSFLTDNVIEMEQKFWSVDIELKSSVCVGEGVCVWASLGTGELAWDCLFWLWSLFSFWGIVIQDMLCLWCGCYKPVNASRQRLRILSKCVSWYVSHAKLTGQNVKTLLATMSLSAQGRINLQ